MGDIAIAYKGKDNQGFHDSAPWILDDFPSADEASKRAKELITEGYKDVTLFRYNEADMPEEFSWDYVRENEVKIIDAPQTWLNKLLSDMSDADLAGVFDDIYELQYVTGVLRKGSEVSNIRAAYSAQHRSDEHTALHIIAEAIMFECGRRWYNGGK